MVLEMNDKFKHIKIFGFIFFCKTDTAELKNFKLKM